MQTYFWDKVQSWNHFKDRWKGSEKTVQRQGRQARKKLWSYSGIGSAAELVLLEIL